MIFTLFVRYFPILGVLKNAIGSESNSLQWISISFPLLNQVRFEFRQLINPSINLKGYESIEHRMQLQNIVLAYTQDTVSFCTRIFRRRNHINGNSQLDKYQIKSIRKFISVTTSNGKKLLVLFGHTECNCSSQSKWWSKQPISLWRKCMNNISNLCNILPCWALFFRCELN